MNRRRWLSRSSAAALAGWAFSKASAVPAPLPAPVSLGALPRELGERAPQEQLQRRVSARALSGWSHTPLEQLSGLMTPSDLHFERHHGGIPAIDPGSHELLVHGLVDQAKRFTVADLKRMPGVTATYFLECSGNGYASTLPPDRIPGAISPGELDGLFSQSEWSGVRLSTLFAATGINPKARWALAEGADSAAMTRSIPVAKLMDDAIIAYAQNGEALRPAQGYPLRLFLPGYEGNMSIKWLRRLELSDRPFMTREETSKYSDAQVDGKVRLFSFTMGPKSLILSPAFPQVVPGRGYWEIRGLAWSGHGRIHNVEVSVDAGRRWRPAQLDGADLPKAARLFRFGWNWNGQPTELLSRATDEHGNVQQRREQHMQGRGPGTVYHNNAIRSWRVAADGQVSFGLAMAQDTGL